MFMTPGSVGKETRQTLTTSRNRIQCHAVLQPMCTTNLLILIIIPFDIEIALNVNIPYDIRVSYNNIVR